MVRFGLASLIVGFCGVHVRAAASVLETTDQPAIAPRKLLSFPVTRSTHTDELSDRRRREVRRDTVLDTDTTVFNYSSVSYLVELEMGTPAQKVKVVVDTGSSELWVNPDCSKASSEPQQEECIDNGSYDPSGSSTARISNRMKALKYGLGKATIRYVEDDIALPNSDVDLSGVRFGVATESDYVSHGILGLSFGNGLNLEYNSFIDELVDQKIVDSRTVSIALGTKDEQDHSGLITFGGVDTKKFIGDLHTAPILERQNNETFYRYWVNLDSVSITDSKDNSKTYSNESFPVFFDTGSTLSYLPKSIVDSLASDIGGRYSEALERVIVPCGLQGQLHFTFGDYTVDVDLEEFTWELSDGVTCAMGAQSEEDGSYVLGASFLRSVYTVYDLDTPALHFAHYANCGTNLQEIPKGKNTAGKFTGECGVEDIPSASSNGTSRRRVDGAADVDGDDDNAAPRYLINGGAMWMGVGLVVSYHAAWSFL
ncbi:uncharacterized protein DNG_02638 [Cephalotrichum gorgonifer]|uniref:Peptidase A1 domain-containing protein n=1 Tax=Cephalotrichum gorgonifer TaxID=2041049 RepID=A0AAE8SSU7_9PEZI|nr:uncharacterized protein DNG_02638 [Cephalotrichum gorgonifer]